MCINKEYSLTALIVSWSIGGFLIYRNRGMDRWNATFLITFATMQLLDLALWILYDVGKLNSLWNLIISKYMIPILLSLEILSVYVGSQLYKNNNTTRGLTTRLLTDISSPATYYQKILLLVAIIMCWFNIIHSNQTVIGAEGNLVWGDCPHQSGIWKYITGMVFIGFLIYPYLEYVDTQPLAAIIIIYLVATLVYSFVRGSGWGSYWCWIANFLAIIMLVIPSS
jgi:hypothetical protein